MTLQIGFLGHGFMGTAHANALARLPMFFPDAPSTDRHVLIGRDKTSLAADADRLGFTRTETDWRSVLDEIDILYNLAPNALHAEPSIAALERDIHVLSEKPLANNRETAERMADAATSSDATAGVAFNYRFVPAIQYAAELISDIGKIHHVSAQYLQEWLSDPNAPWTWRNDAEVAGSGALGDLASHLIDLARFLIADHAGQINHVTGHLQTVVTERPVVGTEETRPVTVDDACSVWLGFETGAIGTLHASRVANGHQNDLEICVHGEHGSLRFSLERLNELQVCKPGNRGYERILVTDETDPYIKSWWPPGHVLGWEHTFVHENYEFLRAVVGDTEYQPGFNEGVIVQRVLDAAVQSDEDGCRIYV